MDHAGQDYLLPNARIIAQRREIQNAAAPNIFPVQFYDRLNIARIINDFWTRVEVLDGDAELFPGIRAADARPGDFRDVSSRNRIKIQKAEKNYD